MTAAQRPHRCPFLEWEPEPHPEMRSTVPSAPTQRGRAGAPPPSPRGKPGLGLELWTPVSLSAPGRQTPGRERSSRLGLPPVRERGSREAREGFTPKGPSCAPRALNPKGLSSGDSCQRRAELAELQKAACAAWSGRGCCVLQGQSRCTSASQDPRTNAQAEVFPRGSRTGESRKVPAPSDAQTPTQG